MMKRCRLCGLVFAVLFCISHQTFAQKQVYLVTSEREPYIGRNLPNKGYVYELGVEAFQKAGYEVDIAFYPLARATRLAQWGKKAGILPIYYENALEQY